MRRTVTLVQARGKWLVVALCSFEVVAVASGRAPTLTQLSARHRWLGPVLVGGLAVHLARTPRVVPRPVADECLLCPVPF
jgi:hypothetical protein